MLAQYEEMLIPSHYSNLPIYKNKFWEREYKKLKAKMEEMEIYLDTLLFVIHIIVVSECIDLYSA